MKVIKITGSSAGNKPAVFVDGGIHAREWISPAFVNNMVYKVCSLIIKCMRSCLHNLQTTKHFSNLKLIHGLGICFSLVSLLLVFYCLQSHAL